MLQGNMTRRALMAALELKDGEHFRNRYLLPALESGWIEMTHHDINSQPPAASPRTP
jgi:hypothetical protein